MFEATADRKLLTELADAYGVATEFWSYAGELKEISNETITKILAAMDVDASSDERCRDALEAARTRTWRRVLPECKVVRCGAEAYIPVHLPSGSDVEI